MKTFILLLLTTSTITFCSEAPRQLHENPLFQGALNTHDDFGGTPSKEETHDEQLTPIQQPPRKITAADFLHQD